MALCLVPLYGVISLKEKNVEIFNTQSMYLVLAIRGMLSTELKLHCNEVEYVGRKVTFNITIPVSYLSMSKNFICKKEQRNSRVTKYSAKVD